MRALDGQTVAVGAHSLQLTVERAPRQTAGTQAVRVTIKADGAPLATRMVRATMSIRNPLDTFNVGQDDGNTVVADYPSGAPFPGALRNIRFAFTAGPVKS